MDLAAWRRETRTRLIEARVAIPPEDHARASLKIESSLEELLEDLPPQAISAYWPFRNEMDLRGVMERLRSRGWVTALPRVVGPRMPLEFLRWETDSEMESGVYGIPIPRNRDVVLPTVVVTSLVAFDLKNFRLGYGAGYYDRTLASLPGSPQSIGVGFEMSRLDTIYPLETDIPMDFIVTEAGIQRRAR